MVFSGREIENMRATRASRGIRKKVIVRLCVIKLTFGVNENKWIMGLEMDRARHLCFVKNPLCAARTDQASQFQWYPCK